MTAHGTGRAKRDVALRAAIMRPSTLPAPAASAANSLSTLERERQGPQLGRLLKA
ncbi:hypothetical protein G7043_40660 [Lentzea sp. NEAU-D13]|uniref:Uncharacterized protein n=1 Tax=Lentzea alba TaxID=2714351 RepID=A0A7C9RXC5_9PSEU|nr:hypothetical protein [Lentzea alba]NGY65228.1 hypothetical protein [Lentzea alba]